MKLRSIIVNLLVFCATYLSSAWLFQVARELRDTEILPAKFAQQRPLQASSRFQIVGHLPTDHFVSALQFLNENEGWCADRDNLWHTDDGGQTWQFINSSGVSSFHFINSHEGWMSNGELYRTGDGGHTWTLIVTPMSGFAGSLWSFHLQADGKIGWIAGGIYYPMEKPWLCINTAAGTLKSGTPGCLNGAVFRTDDGGRTWREQVTRSGIGRFMSITFVDEKHGWAAGDAGVLYTTDGGNTWRDDDRFKRSCEDYYDLQDTHPTEIKFLDQKHGLLMFRSGLVAKSTDGGQSWCGVADLPSAALPEQCYTEPPGKFRDIAFKDANYGIALDCVGVMFETHDGGATWQKVAIDAQLRSILFHNNTYDWVATPNLELVKMKL
jgi:photosystem II stability/assembly factor-like uncharacterized protein